MTNIDPRALGLKLGAELQEQLEKLFEEQKDASPEERAAAMRELEVMQTAIIEAVDPFKAGGDKLEKWRLRTVRDIQLLLTGRITEGRLISDTAIVYAVLIRELMGATAAIAAPMIEDLPGAVSAEELGEQLVACIKATQRRAKENGWT